MLTGRRPASRELRFHLHPVFNSAPLQRPADPPAQLSGLLRPGIGRSRYSLEQIRDMAPSLCSEAPHTGLQDQLRSFRGPIPVPRCFRDAPRRAGAAPPSEDRAALHVGPELVARLSLLHLTETALSQNATGQERARQRILACFRSNSAPFVKRSPERGEEIRNYISHGAVGIDNLCNSSATF